MRFTEYGRKPPIASTFERKTRESCRFANQPLELAIELQEPEGPLSHAAGGSGGGRGATAYSYCLLCLGHYSPLAWQQQLSRLDRDTQVRRGAQEITRYAPKDWRAFSA